MGNLESVQEKLKSLRLNTMAEMLPFALDEESKKNRGFSWLLDHLAAAEMEARWQRSVVNRFRQSKLLEKPTIDQFDFKFHSSREKNRPRVLKLLDLDFLDNLMDVVFIGNPGTGKSFLAKAIGYQGCQANHKVLFTPVMDMINHLIAAQADNSLLKKLRYYQSPALLICDELGYLPLDQQGSSLFFQVISARHGRASTVITTNLAFRDWGQIFNNVTVAVAIADRLVANSEVILMDGPSYRKKGKKKK